MRNAKRFILILLVGIIMLCLEFRKAQAQNEIDKWDNQFFVGNKVTGGSEKWRYSGELQSRFIQDFQALDRWFFEGVATYMHSEHWEIVPDFRFSVRPDFLEARPGFGIIRKDLIKNGDKVNQQFVHQVKYQADIGNNRTNHGVRYILFYNNVLSEKLIASAIGGAFLSWKDNFSGVEFIRVGGALAYILNEQHSMNFTYFAGAADTGSAWVYSGSFVVQLVINIKKDYKYVPAKYISF